MRIWMWTGALMAAALPVVVSAHVKWFAEAGGAARPYALTDGPVLAWIAVIAAAVFVGVLLEKKLRPAAWLAARLDSWTPAIISITSIGFGLSLIIFSWQGFILAPNLPAAGAIGNTLLGLQAAAGAMILFGFFGRIGALLALLLWVLGIGEYGLTAMAEALEIAALAIFVAVAGRPKWSVIDARGIEQLTARWREYALPVMRVGLGLNLMLLAFTEKFLSPGMTQEFLSRYDWNFMRAMGIGWCDNYWFAFSAGAAEFLIGLLLALGLVTRLTTLALAGFLVTTLALLGPVELVGHLPHFAMAIALLTLGAETKLKAAN